MMFRNSGSELYTVALFSVTCLTNIVKLYNQTSFKGVQHTNIFLAVFLINSARIFQIRTEKDISYIFFSMIAAQYIQ